MLSFDKTISEISVSKQDEADDDGEDIDLLLLKEAKIL